MARYRIHRLTAVGLVTTVGLFLVLAAQAGLTAAATDSSDAITSAALQGKVRIHLRGSVSGSQFPPVVRGRFIISGAIYDRGRFVDRGGQRLGLSAERTLFGAKGTIRLTVGPAGSWRITKGTRAYTGLRGRGRTQGLYSRSVDLTMKGTVSQ